MKLHLRLPRPLYELLEMEALHDDTDVSHVFLQILRARSPSPPVPQASILFAPRDVSHDQRIDAALKAELIREGEESGYPRLSQYVVAILADALLEN